MSVENMKMIHIGASTMEEIELYNEKDVGNVVYVEGFGDICQQNQKKLKEFNERTNKNYICLHALVWYKSGETKTLKRFNNHTFGSILGINDKEWKWGGIKDIGKWDETLETITLDKLLSDNNINTEEYKLLTIDVQGAEYEVFLGSPKLLPGINCIKFEASTREFYKGQVLHKDLKKFLEERGFIVEDPETDHRDVFAYREGCEDLKKHFC